jgi:regulator of RNase E activity RraA|tara:strand:- start:237 stop:935 length:699 start_codon:yes stop_codon:yes gene_type:complete
MIEEPPRLTININMRRPTEAQIAAFQGVQTGFVVDALLGRGALSQNIGPIGEGRDINCVAAGAALTADCGPGDILATLATLKFIRPGDMVVSAFAAHQGCAAAGDRILGMMKNCGAAGFVTDGPIRDYIGVVAVGLPVWCTGLMPASPFTKGPGSVGFPIQIGGQEVETGDMIVADQDGVVIVPFELIDETILALSQVKDMEMEMDKKVGLGLTIPESISDLLRSIDVKYID